MKGLSGSDSTVRGTIAVNSGKWQFEGRVVNKTNHTNNNSNGYNNSPTN